MANYDKPLNGTGVGQLWERIKSCFAKIAHTHTYSDIEDISDAFAGYATESWVYGKGYLTAHQDVSAYAKTTYVDTADKTLQANIDAITGAAGKDTANGKTVLTLTHAAENSVHTLTGLQGTGLIPVQFQPAAEYQSGETIKIGGSSYTVRRTDGSDSGVIWQAGVHQAAVIDTNAKTITVSATADKVPEHNGDSEAHPDIRAELVNLDARCTRLEAAVTSEVTHNQWQLTFEDLADADVESGSWDSDTGKIIF